MNKKLLSLIICCIMLTGCGASPTHGLSEQYIKSKEDILKDSQAHVDIEETFITKFDGINAVEYSNGEYNFVSETDDYFKNITYSDEFLGYDCYYTSYFSISDLLESSISGYSINILFDDKNEYEIGVSDIDNYLEELSSNNSEDLSSYNDSLGKAYFCNTSNNKDYVIVIHKDKQDLSAYFEDCINILVLDYTYYSNDFITQIK